MKHGSTKTWRSSLLLPEMPIVEHLSARQVKGVVVLAQAKVLLQDWDYTCLQGNEVDPYENTTFLLYPVLYNTNVPFVSTPSTTLSQGEPVRLHEASSGLSINVEAMTQCPEFIRFHVV